MNLPKQECVGEWCPTFLNLRRPSRECIGRHNGIKVIPLNPESFSRLSEIGQTARESGARLRRLLSF